jgi:hypothetical protein
MNATIITTISSRVVNSIRQIKFLRFGKDDIQETEDISPYGTDANPIKGMTAIYAQTSVQGEPVIIGYINKNQLAEPGEHRIYSTDANGELKAFIWLKADGKIHLGGDADNAVRYSKLKDTIDSINSFLNQQLPLIASGIATGGGTYTPGVANFEVTAAKIDEIKTP